MTVKSITKDDKAYIGGLYASKHLTVKQLAEQYRTSTRTIGRVLEERGLATPVPRLKDEAHRVMLLLKQHNVTYPHLRDILENHAASTKPAPKNPAINALHSDLCYINR
jgi:hypothetical protein